MLTIEIERKAKLVSPFQTKLATNLIASRQFVFFASVKHCFFKVSACSPEGKSWQDVEKGFEDLHVLTNELVVVVVQLLLRVPAVAIVGGVRHLHLLGHLLGGGESKKSASVWVGCSY